IILYVGGVMSLHGAVTVGTAIAFIQYSQRFFRPIQDLSDKYNILQAAMASSERIFKLLDTPVTIADPAEPVPLAAAGAGSGVPTDGDRSRGREVAVAAMPALERLPLSEAKGSEGSPSPLPAVEASSAVAPPRAEFRRVSFAYQGDHRVIENVSFS